MMDLIPAQYRLLAVILIASIVIGGAYGTGYYKGYAGEHEKFELFKDQVAVAAAKQEVETKAQINEAKQVTEDARNDYTKSLDAVTAYYAGRVPKPTPGSCKLPPVPRASAGADATTPDSLPLAAAITTLQLESLQGWIRDQQAVSH